ncbi:tRNA dihydrouridine synthase DusB [Halioglobus japonicus]|uniref:tRNA-dihydrouridine synthase B n=1 Tax=Halioglobus japonicus TaxID=930805 RepID=A0AAP8MBX5_9GAMM|nr:tRNA dihydrouridine synthase DusB [Halioglobus japonicus]AQA17014.1 tRNA dihydrouridine synthase DusB [Halioglobus japonicus]PLW84920.1 tRNA dihydrouridine synthase DusB [Halioglobus japonicus]GHD18525.1 tRNA-dihydrouridine synthase B [Halioglobus japonicus]
MPQIGPYTLANPVALAPMAGVTDLPFRRLCARMGAGLVVSEMVTSDPSLRETRKTSLRTIHDAEVEPRSVQIAGSEPEQLAEAARYNLQLGAQIIDINMGCPAKKVCKKAAGSALLADEALVADILQTVTAAVDVPVTLKIRTGSAPDARNGVTIARIAEDAGIAALAVHGRTRACKFAGSAEYDTIAAIAAATQFPVFANGDITSPAKAAEVLKHTGAAGVMVGRAAQGRPWLCGQIAHYLATGQELAPPSLLEQHDILLQHLTDLHAFYGEFMGVRIARKHVSWYLEHQRDYRAQRQTFNRLESAEAQLGHIQNYFHHLCNEELAA